MQTRHGKCKTWSKRVEDWRSSGLTAKEFGAKHGLPAKRLWNWSYRLRAAEKVNLVPVTIMSASDSVPSSTVEAEPTKPALTLELGGVRIVVPTGFDRTTLQAVLDALDERPAKGAVSSCQATAPPHYRLQVPSPAQIGKPGA
jgi:transposase